MIENGNGQVVNTNNSVMSVVDFHNIIVNLDKILKEDLKKDKEHRFIRSGKNNSNLLIIKLDQILNELYNIDLSNLFTISPNGNNGLIGTMPEYTNIKQKELHADVLMGSLIETLNSLLDNSGFDFSNKKENLMNYDDLINLISESSSRNFKNVLNDRFNFYETKYEPLPYYSQGNDTKIKEDSILLSFNEKSVLNENHKSFKSYCTDTIIRNLQNDAENESSANKIMQKLRSFTTNPDNLDLAKINKFVESFISDPIPRVKEVVACKSYLKYIYSISNRTGKDNELFKLYISNIDEAFNYYDESNCKSDNDLIKEINGDKLFTVDFKSNMSVATGFWNILKIRGILNDGALLQGADQLNILYPVRCKFGLGFDKTNQTFQHYKEKFRWYLNLSHTIESFPGTRTKKSLNPDKTRIDYLLNYVFIYNYVYAPLLHDDYNAKNTWIKFYEQIDNSLSLKEFIDRINQYFPNILNENDNKILENKLDSIVTYIKSVQKSVQNPVEYNSTVYVGVLNNILKEDWVSTQLSSNIFKTDFSKKTDLLKHVRIITDQNIYEEMKDNFIISFPLECKCFSNLKIANETITSPYIKTQIDGKRKVLPVISDAVTMIKPSAIDGKTNYSGQRHDAFCKTNIAQCKNPLIYIKNCFGDDAYIQKVSEKQIYIYNVYLNMLLTVLLDLIFERMNINFGDSITYLNLYPQNYNGNNGKKSLENAESNKINFLFTEYKNNANCLVQVLSEKYNISKQGLVLDNDFNEYKFQNSVKSFFANSKMEIQPTNFNIDINDEKYGIIIISSVMLQGKANQFGLRNIFGESFVFGKENGNYYIQQFGTYNTPVDESNGPYKLKNYPNNKIKRIIKKMYENNVKNIILIAKNPYSNTFEFDQKKRNYYFLDSENIEEFIGEYKDLRIFPMNYDLFSSIILKKETDVDYGCSFVASDTNNILKSSFNNIEPSEYPIVNFTGMPSKIKMGSENRFYKTTINYKLNYSKYNGESLHWASSLMASTTEKKNIMFVLFSLHCYTNLTGSPFDTKNSFKINPFERYSTGSGNDKNSLIKMCTEMQYLENGYVKKFNYLSFLIYIFDLYNERANKLV